MLLYTSTSFCSGSQDDQYVYIMKSSSVEANNIPDEDEKEEFLKTEPEPYAVSIKWMWV